MALGLPRSRPANPRTPRGGGGGGTSPRLFADLRPFPNVSGPRQTRYYVRSGLPAGPGGASSPRALAPLPLSARMAMDSSQVPDSHFSGLFGARATEVRPMQGTLLPGALVSHPEGQDDKKLTRDFMMRTGWETKAGKAIQKTIAVATVGQRTAVVDEVHADEDAMAKYMEDERLAAEKRARQIEKLRRLQEEREAAEAEKTRGPKPKGLDQFGSALWHLFCVCDDNSDGKLDKEEFVLLLQTAGERKNKLGTLARQVLEGAQGGEGGLVHLWDKDSDGYINWEEFLDLGHKFPQLVELKSALQDTVYARQQARWKSGAHKANLILRGLAK